MHYWVVSLAFDHVDRTDRPEFQEVFGTLGYIDRLLGTDKELATLQDGDVR